MLLRLKTSELEGRGTESAFPQVQRVLKSPGKVGLRHFRFTLECPGLLWNIHTVYTEKCQCTPNQFPPTKCLRDNWCTPETCVSNFRLVEINFSVHLYFQCEQCNYSKVNMDTPKLTWNVFICCSFECGTNS